MKLTKMDCTLNERDTLLDMLEGEKQLMTIYTTALYEGNNKSLRKNFSSNYLSVSENQYCLYTNLLNRGYYTPTYASQESIAKTCTTFKKQQPQLKTNL